VLEAHEWGLVGTAFNGEQLRGLVAEALDRGWNTAQTPDPQVLAAWGAQACRNVADVVLEGAA
jgi:hypothetical protein